MKTLDEVIAECRAAGVSQVEFHPDGSVAKLSLAPAIPPRPTKSIGEETAEKIEEAKKVREPRRDALELAEELINDIRRETGRA